jgi:hypothetical protein
LAKPSQHLLSRSSQDKSWVSADSLLLLPLPLLQVVFEPELLPSVSVVSDAPAAWAGDLLAVAVTEEDLSSSGEQQQQQIQRQLLQQRQCQEGVLQQVRGSRLTSVPAPPPTAAAADAGCLQVTGCHSARPPGCCQQLQ